MGGKYTYRILNGNLAKAESDGRERKQRITIYDDDVNQS
jgi:hypothetical protein